MKTQKEIEEVCKKLKPIIGNQADQLWYMYLSGDEGERKDIVIDIDILAEKLLKSQALSKQEILLDPPTVENSNGSFFIGNILYNKKKINQLYLKPEDFLKQIGIFAITGEGKTNLAYLLALQLLRSKTPLIIIDWKRSWRNLLSLKDKFPELKDVQVFTIGRDVLPFHWNPFRPPPGADKELWISTISEVLEKSHLSGPGVAYYYNKIYLKLFRQLKSDNFFPNFYDGLKEIQNYRAYGRELNWKQTAMRIFQNFTIGNASNVFNARNPIRFEDLLNKPIILELDLEMPKQLRIFFSELILRWIHLYRLNQGETDKLRHVLFLEEAHNLFAENSWYKDTNSLENIYREIRAFGQGIVTITQHPSLLPIYLLGNCHTQVYLGLQHADDIRATRKSLFLNYDEESYPNMLNVGECIIKIKNRIEPCLVKTPLIPVQKGHITDKWLKENTPWNTHVNTPGNLFKSSDANRHQKDRYFPRDKYCNAIKGKTSEIEKSLKLLVDILVNPFSAITERYKRLKMNPKYGNKFKNNLVSSGYIQAKKIITSKGWITLFDITHKGKTILRDIGHDIKITNEGIVHKFWKFKIAEFYKEKGFKVDVEKNINGRPDIIVKNGTKKVAVEIETGKSDVIKNIRRNLKLGFDEIICVGVNRFVEDKIIGKLENRDLVDEKIRVMNVIGYAI